MDRGGKAAGRCFAAYLRFTIYDLGNSAPLAQFSGADAQRNFREQHVLFVRKRSELRDAAYGQTILGCLLPISANFGPKVVPISANFT